MMPTARVLCDMGVDEMRIIRTTDVPRWAANAAGACLPMTEYYEKMLDFAREYMDSGMQMDIDIWQFLRLFPRSKSLSIMPVSCAEGEYTPTYPGCRGNRGLVAVTSSSDVVPCMQMSGLLLEQGSHIIQIFSNGALVSRKLLSELDKRGTHPEFNMSYDGLGWHGWLRGIPGAEEAVDRAFRLYREMGFPTGAEVCIHAGNKHLLRASGQWRQALIQGDAGGRKQGGPGSGKRRQQRFPVTGLINARINRIDQYGRYVTGYTAGAGGSCGCLRRKPFCLADFRRQCE